MFRNFLGVLGTMIENHSFHKIIHVKQYNWFDTLGLFHVS